MPTVTPFQKVRLLNSLKSDVCISHELQALQYLHPWHMGRIVLNAFLVLQQQSNPCRHSEHIHPRIFGKSNKQIQPVLNMTCSVAQWEYFVSSPMTSFLAVHSRVGIHMQEYWIKSARSWIYLSTSGCKWSGEYTTRGLLH